MNPQQLLSTWPARAAAGWVTSEGRTATGPQAETFAWASVTKVVTSMAIWLAVEEGSVDWDDAVGPPGSTLAHLMAHASGLAPDSEQILAAPGQRRIYSNRGIELAADHLVRRTGIEFAEYVGEGILAPLGLAQTTWAGSPASGASGPLTDLLLLARELMEPTLFSHSTVERASTVAFPGLSGVLPGFGRQVDNAWGLGVEIRDSKQPHWTGSLNSPRTFGHFGQSGAFLWVDPVRAIAAASLADRPFGPWAAQAWPELADAILKEAPS
jgi:CubicO group peptidase (beta-lactamase class C family)